MRWSTWRTVVSLVLLGTVVPAARGADESLVGSRVRIRVGPMGEPSVGVLEGATPDELVIRPEGAAPPVHVRRSDVLQLEVSRGPRRHTLKGLLAGAVAWGAMVGLVAAFDTLDESGVGEPLVIGGMLAVGAGIGSLIKTERWERIPGGRVSVRIGPTPGGLQARIAVRF